MQAIRDIFARLALMESPASPRWRALIATLGLLLCATGLGMMEWIARPPFSDAGALDPNTDLYLQAADTSPLLAGALSGLNFVLGPDLLGLLWPMLCTLCLIGAISALSRQFGVKLAWRWVMLILGVMLIGKVAHIDNDPGQMSAIVLFLMVGGLRLRSQGRIIAASLAFAAMMALQPSMGAIAVYFVLRGDWRMARWSLAMGAGAIFASFLPTSPNIWDTANGWLETMQRLTLPSFLAQPDNSSVLGLLLRLFTHTPYSDPWIHARLLVPAFMALAISLACTLAILGLHVGGGQERQRIGPPAAVLLLECAFVLSLVRFVGPTSDSNSFIVCFAGLFGAMIVGYERIAGGSRNSGLWLASILAWALPCLFIVVPESLWLTLGVQTGWGEGWGLLLSGSDACLLLLAGSLTAVAMWRERELMACLREIFPRRAFGKRRAQAQLSGRAAHMHAQMNPVR